MTAPASVFRRAERTATRLKIAVQGPSGAGKTEGALNVARALAGPTGRIVVIDTENGSASLYADRFEFDTAPLEPPYTTKRYIELVDLAVAEGYSVVVLDSLSHQWAGDGGVLGRKEAVDARGGNHFSNWAPFTKEHEEFKAKLLNAPIHIVATMRTKADYVLQGADGGKQTPKKIGTAPIQRDGMEYEFTIVFELQMDHKAGTSKDRTGLYDSQLIDLRDKKALQRLVDWHQSAKPAAAAPPPAPAGPVLVKDAPSELDWALAFPHPQNGTLFGSLDTVQLEELVAWANTQIKRAQDQRRPPSSGSQDIRKAAKLILAERDRAAVFGDEADDEMPGAPPAPAAEGKQLALIPEEKKAEPATATSKRAAVDSIFESAQRLNHLLNSPSVSDATKADLRPSILTRGGKNTPENVAWFDQAIERVEEEILATGGSAPAPAVASPPAPTPVASASPVADELVGAVAAEEEDLFP